MVARKSSSGDDSSAPGKKLSALLDALGWRPERLAREVNAVLAQRADSDRSVHAKTPYGWLKGQTPHPPIRGIVVQVLARELGGYRVVYSQVWPSAPAREHHSRPADGAMLDLPWTQSGLHQFLEEWGDVLTRRQFSELSGAALTVTAWSLLDRPTPALTVLARDGEQITEPLVCLIEDTVARAQQLDDQQGGALGYVADQFTAVERVVRRCKYTPATGRRLYAALAQFAQTAGFMAYDSADDGAAQGWYLTGLRAAHLARDRSLIASILSLLSNQVATGGNPSDAVQLASAAELAAEHAPATVQALVAARGCLAYAAAADLSGLRRAHEESQARLAAETGPVPRFASYASRTELDAIAGRSMVMLARRLPHHSLRLLAAAEPLLHGRAFTDPAEIPQRSALRHGAWLGLAHAQTGDLSQAIVAGRHAAMRLPTVTSARSVALLRQLRDDLASHAHRHPPARDLVKELNRKLPAGPPHVTPA
jgi:hypothetical protein